MTRNSTLFRMMPLICLLLLGTVGCRPKFELIPTTGQVLLDGEPLPMGNIMVAPADGPVAYSKIDSQGRFELQTMDGIGCVAGRHPITVTANEIIDSGNAIRQLVPDRYADFFKSKLFVDVSKDGEPIVIELTSGGVEPRVLSTEGDIDPSQL